MEKSQETQVSAPPATAGSRLQPARALLEAEFEKTRAELDPAWHWCPSCKLASMKAVACPSCGAAFVAAPEAGIPGTPHRPKVAAGRSRLALAGSLAAAAALIAGIATSIFVLASHGASTVDSGAFAARGSTVDGTSAFSIGALHGTLRLQGGWGTNMQRVQLPATVTGGAMVRNDLSVGKGSETITIGSFQSDDPSSVLNQFVTTKPQDSLDAMGNKRTTEASRDVSIAGYTAVAQDFELRNPKGGLTSRGTLYVVNAGDHVVVVSTSAGPTQANDLSAIEQALVNIG